MYDAPYLIREPIGKRVPLLVSLPHSGTGVPAEIRRRFAAPEIRGLPDTDWHLERLYDFVPRLGARMIIARYNRYVVDLNRSKEGTPLYPGRFETSVVPRQTFHGVRIYEPGNEPTAAEVIGRIEHFWQPYHDRIAEELCALRDEFGYAILFDAHSIVSRVPQIHEDRLPAFVLGTADGASTHEALADAMYSVLQASGVETTRNDPFHGGFITRTYGLPDEGLHAMQLEMSQRMYMNEQAPFEYRDDKAVKLQVVLCSALEMMLQTAMGSA